MNQATIDKLRLNPHYKGYPNGTDPERIKPEEDENVKTFGVLPKHPTGPKTRIYKKRIAK